MTNNCGLKLSAIRPTSSTQLNLAGRVNPVLFFAKRPSSMWFLRQASRGSSPLTPPQSPSPVESPIKAILDFGSALGSALGSTLGSLWLWAAPTTPSDSASAAQARTPARRTVGDRNRGRRRGDTVPLYQ